MSSREIHARKLSVLTGFVRLLSIFKNKKHFLKKQEKREENVYIYSAFACTMAIFNDQAQLNSRETRMAISSIL